MKLIPVFLCVIAPAAVARAQAGNETTPAPSDAGKLVVETVAGEVATRPLAGVSVASLSELSAASVRFEGVRPMPASPAKPRELADVGFAGGDALSARVASGNGDKLTLELPHGQSLAVDVDQLRSLVFGARVPANERGKLQAPEHGDRLLWLRPGGLDRVDGTLESFGADAVQFESVLGSRAFPWSEIAALYIEPVGELSAKRLPDPTKRVAIELATGGRLRAELVKLDASGVELAKALGGALKLPLAAVSEITLDDGSLRFLSDSAPTRAVEGWPEGDELGMKWPYRLDRAVLGGPLLSGGATWRRGIGVHAPSRLEWELDGSWSSLRGKVAVDDSVLLLGARGSVRFRILLGDAATPAWQSEVLRGGDPPVDIGPLELRGVTKLVLEVSMEGDLYVADRANWLRMLLVR